MTTEARSRDSRWRILVRLCAICAALTVAYAWMSVSRSHQRDDSMALPPIPNGVEVRPVERPDRTKPTDGSAAGGAAASAAPAAPVGSAPVTFLVRHTGSDRSFGFLAVDPGNAALGGRRATPLACERLHYAAGRGVCLVAGRPLLTSYSAILFDAALESRRTIPVDGIPSRTRVSPDGRLAAITVFVGGHSYADNDFVTATTIINAATGDPVVANLEELQVVRDGQPFKAIDFNFWGVTFAADSDRFYATLGSGGVSYLIAGSVAARAARVLRSDVECPALSPDNTRIAYKKPLHTGATRTWRLATLDLASYEETTLAETRSIDDQAEWLDNSRVLYGVVEESRGGGTSAVWVVPADGTGRPEIFLNAASSPAVVRR
jgi:hypothetical protein